MGFLITLWTGITTTCTWIAANAEAIAAFTVGEARVIGVLISLGATKEEAEDMYKHHKEYEEKAKETEEELKKSQEEIEKNKKEYEENIKKNPRSTVKFNSC